MRISNLFAFENFFKFPFDSLHSDVGHVHVSAFTRACSLHWSALFTLSLSLSHFFSTIKTHTNASCVQNKQPGRPDDLRVDDMSVDMKALSLSHRYIHTLYTDTTTVTVWSYSMRFFLLHTACYRHRYYIYCRWKLGASETIFFF